MKTVHFPAQFHPRHSRHHHVGENDVELCSAVSELVERITGIDGENGIAAKRGQSIRRELSDLDIVLNDQDAGALADR